MADIFTCPPLTRESVKTAHEIIKPYVHLTPVVTCSTLDALSNGNKLLFKCENTQKIGAFKARGAFHALSHLLSNVGHEALCASGGVITHSSGNHAQALALAAKTFNVPAHIVMPSISAPSKIAGTEQLGARIAFSGSNSEEREALVEEIRAKTGATLVPPYDHPDIILGQGTLALEFEEQVKALSVSGGLDAVIAPIGGGGMMGGVCTALEGTGIRCFGAEPAFQGANDCEKGLREGKRVESVNSLTIADGARTPVGEIPWKILTDKKKFAGVYSVSEDEIKMAMRLLMERAKVFVEPTAALGLAVVLFNQEFRELIKDKGWNIGVVLSGGNTTVEALAKLFKDDSDNM
ncbi:tryptophan synthase beta subunit-like PLP-dependent enzyme [Piedraia hortae CBS 480.64]|uniref:Tryptophan synthase beta subunit-like PLP-dependent enzyme n=1 Tax=Piedraia hortae CBS 480.64 TaxID=1314780 RepID=A0A6A7BQH5_9PEZI|nr:tryptophan synthase beta subunit-like PLP-dependent enzyme [Piedraia hortae CBS 480.64]